MVCCSSSGKQRHEWPCWQAGKVVTQPLRAAGHGMAADLATGLLTQTAAGILFTPIDIIKERLQV